MNDKIKYWLELSDYDFNTAKAMLNSKRFLYVGFMCHQIEPLNIEAGYPSRKEGLLKSLNEVKCQDILDKTNELQRWIKMKL
jgi:hypothetical protein